MTPSCPRIRWWCSTRAVMVLGGMLRQRGGQPSLHACTRHACMHACMVTVCPHPHARGYLSDDMLLQRAPMHVCKRSPPAVARNSHARCHVIGRWGDQSSCNVLSRRSRQPSPIPHNRMRRKAPIPSAGCGHGGAPRPPPEGINSWWHYMSSYAIGLAHCICLQ